MHAARCKWVLDNVVGAIYLFCFISLFCICFFFFAVWQLSARAELLSSSTSTRMEICWWECIDRVQAVPLWDKVAVYMSMTGMFMWKIRLRSILFHFQVEINFNFWNDSIDSIHFLCPLRLNDKRWVQPQEERYLNQWVWTWTSRMNEKNCNDVDDEMCKHFLCEILGYSRQPRSECGTWHNCPHDACEYGLFFVHLVLDPRALIKTYDAPQPNDRHRENCFYGFYIHNTLYWLTVYLRMTVRCAD